MKKIKISVLLLSGAILLGSCSTMNNTAKGGVICSEILAPDYVPEPFHNREYLWNAVEEIEKHPKAQLAYSFDFALQNEFSLEENITIARQFVMENFVAKGMIVDMVNSSHEQYPQLGRGNCVGTNRIYDNILPDFIFDVVRLPASRSSISCVSKKDRNRALNVLMFLPLV